MESRCFVIRGVINYDMSIWLGGNIPATTAACRAGKK